MSFKQARWAVLSVALAAGAASAADTAGYLLVGGGRSHFNDDCTGVQNCKTNGNALKLVGGWRFTPGLGAEIVALDFGKATGASSGINIELKAKALGGGVLLQAPLSPQFNIGVRLGLAQMKVQALGRAGTITVSESETSTQLYAGLAAAYNFTETLSLEAAYDSSNAKFQDGKSRVTAVTLGLGLRF